MAWQRKGAGEFSRAVSHSIREPGIERPASELRSLDYGGKEEDGTLESVEREQIIRVLKDTRGVIAGLHGAAVRLGLKRTTLQSKMIKLGISRDNYID